MDTQEILDRPNFNETTFLPDEKEEAGWQTVLPVGPGGQNVFRKRLNLQL